MEALIVSQLAPEAFGSYMATGSRKGSAERLMFIEVDPEKLKGIFDTDYAEKCCIPHPDGSPKNSVYLSVYRVLESVPTDAMGTLWLITNDGRALALENTEYSDPDSWPGYALYQELCPAQPLVATTLQPKEFAAYIMEDSNKIKMPAIFFADLILPVLEDETYTGNIGGYFDKMKKHLKSCIDDLMQGKGKKSKVVDRSSIQVFNYQVIGRGLYVGSQNGRLLYYPMLSRDRLKKEHYDWGKSAMIF